jgi:hypothetical protein
MQWASRIIRAESPRVLALFRASVALVFLISHEPRDLALRAARSPSVLVAPHGLGFLTATFPWSPWATDLLRTTYYASAAFLLVGLFTRASALALCLSGYLVFATCQFTGAVLHDMHVLWFAALLAACPCPSALSLDAYFGNSTDPWWRRALGPREPEVQVGLTLFFARTLLGLVYLFPGLHKLHTSGLAWALSDNLQNQMFIKWFEHGVLPVVRIDRYPLLLKALGLGTLAFEIGFVFLVHVGRRTRIALALAGLAFHLSIQVFLFIPFSSLWLCYTALASTNNGEPIAFPKDLRAKLLPARPLLALGALLVGLVFEQGARGRMQSFPFACYPTFEWMAGAELPDLRVVALGSNGQEREVPVGKSAQGGRTQESWGQAFSLSGVYGTPFSEERVVAYLREERKKEHVAQALEGARSVRIERAYYTVAPERWGSAPMRTVTLAELPLRTP